MVFEKFNDPTILYEGKKLPLQSNASSQTTEE
jgi:hypothetical protein